MEIAYVDRDLKNNTASVTPRDKVGSPNKLVCGVGTWRYVIPNCSYVRMTPGYVSPNQENFIGGQDLLFVNMHDGSDFITQIKAINPTAKIVAMPDRRLDETLTHRVEFWHELGKADIVAVRTLHDVAYYRSLVKPPVRWLPSPIGPDFHVLQATNEYPRPDTPSYILTVGHRGIPHSYVNMEALKTAQDYSGLPVIILNPDMVMFQTAKRMGLDFVAYEKCRYKKMLELIRYSAFGIDIMAVSSNHRHAMTHGVLGVPLLVNKSSNMGSVFQSVSSASSPYPTALHFASRMVNDGGMTHGEHDIKRRTLDLYGFDASRLRIKTLIETLFNEEPENTHSM